MVSPVLRGALTDRSELLPLRELPVEATTLLDVLHAQPRLAAHLRLVHDVAAALTVALERRCPGLAFDRVAVLFGAATHDIGKVAHPAELTGSGSAHEPAGHALLLAHGVPERLARFAGTHGTWKDQDRTVEDLLVSLADKIWKGQRVAGLEDLVVDRIAAATGQPRWQAFLSLDEILDDLATDADQRLAFQSAYSASRDVYGAAGREQVASPFARRGVSSPGNA
ncbi:HD domain-containing protein [Dactylosporangium sp. NBC_01737]|uniref:HD domain-containing protein n=1 Tax=Dactylosporangium sp. NBC_01737 TaxID=2975959 RepID=UPI002E0DE23C|nr:HD domain-containing protein [Dactylosporangium sp. NBC_01737]